MDGISDCLIGCWTFIYLSVAMEINRLSKSEIEYELQCRGLPATGAADQLRKSLRKAIRDRRPVNTHVGVPEEELTWCEQNIVTLQTELRNFSGTRRDPIYCKFDAKVTHYIGRIQNVAVEGETALSTWRSRLLKLAMEAYEELESRSVSDHDDSDNEGLPLGTNESNKVVVNEPARVLRDAPIKVDRKSIPVVKWNLTFSGEKGASLGAFLERVAELQVARGITDHELWASAVDLFVGPALIWYRAARRRTTSWSALVTALKQTFQPADYEDCLLEEIRLRTQGKEEPLEIYVAIMENLFARLASPSTERERLRVIRKNLAPYYQDRLSLQLDDINSIHDLLNLGRRVEAGRLRTEKYTAPPPQHSTMEKDLAYSKLPSQFAEVLPFVSQGRLEVVPQFNTASPRVSNKPCWNCKETGHPYRKCPRPLTQFCLTCGNPGVHYADCRKCHKGNATGGK